jgi:pyridinium-3,5-bisthiocarboxylic acid mononucleotide nickel chelatase
MAPCRPRLAEGFLMTVLYFDCFAGAAGDMILGALLDAGLPGTALRAALGGLLPAGAELSAERVVKAGVSATKFRLLEHGGPDRQADGHRRDHERHDHQQHAHGNGHRTVAEIRTLIGRSGLSARAKQQTGELFDRLAEAEATVHQIPVQSVHLHEVGALDSIVDIAGTVFGLEWFGADRIVSSPLNVGGGTIACAHGEFPVPAPATLRLLQGVPVYSEGPNVELVTPTGALLVSGYATSFGRLPPMTIERSGYGAGDRDLPGRPNVLRVVIGEAASGDNIESLVVLECEIDDMNPQLFGVLMDRLLAAGALDVFFTPVQMKKNRPGTLVTVLAPPERRETLSAIVFSETTTIGLRWHQAERECLEREMRTVETPHGSARIKIARRAGTIVNAVPEFEDCTRLAAVGRLSVKDAQALVMKAYLDSRDGGPRSAD